MAAYYHGGSEVQAEGLQTLHLMNTGLIRYPGGQAGPAALAPGNWFVVDAAGNQEHGGGFAGIPIAASAGAHLTPDSAHLCAQPHDAAGVLEFMSRLQYAHWPPVNSPVAAGATVQSVILADDDDGRQAHRHPLQRGLSLRLSTQGPDQYSLCQPEQTMSAPGTGLMPTAGDDQGRISPSSSGVSEGIGGVRSILMGSKYLRVAQELLDEVVSMGSVAEEKVIRGEKPEKEATTTTSPENPTPNQALGGGKQGAELTTSERQELLMKKAKLVGLLDEVEQRYRQYRQQMQMVVTAFEAAAGVGSAKPYTALALRTISRQFRCLRDAISGQIRATGRSLGDEVGGARLKLVDDRLRQQRALQQLGMMQHNAWRPQRGLPEKSVSILRAWLFENFLHPYPKDSDKTMLAKQTGLTRSQVSNWFINARVRLWKPMVEEMYTEEMKDHPEQNQSKDQELPVSEAATSSPDQEPSPPEAEQMNKFQSKIGFIEQNNFPPTAAIDEEMDLETNFKKRRNDASLINNGTQLMDLKPGTGANNVEPIDGCSFNSYQQLGGMGRFDPQQFASSFGNGVVSLTLGLPQLSGAQQPYISNQNCMVMGRRIQIENEETDFFGMGTQPMVHDHTSATGYEKLDIQNSKPFAAQLLHDFVV